MVLKKSLQKFTEGSVPDAVAVARDVANRLIVNESRGPGDIDNAMRRLEAKYGIPYSFLWSLRYRPPTDILVGAWSRLVSAYEVECARHQRRLESERQLMRTLGHAANSFAMRAADSLAGAKDGEA